MSLFNGIHLFDHIGAWRCAVYAADIGFCLAPPRESTVQSLVTYINSGSSASEAWENVFRTSMPSTVAEHAQMRQALHPKPKRLAKMLASWFEHHKALRARPFTTFEALATRLQALAVNTSPDIVKQLLATFGHGCRAERVQDVLLHEHHMDLATSAALTCLVILATALAPQHPVVPPASCGSLTPRPTSWSNVPQVARVQTEAGLPVLASAQPYAVLCYASRTGHASVRIVSEHGEESQFDVHLPVDEQPLWLSHLSSAPTGSPSGHNQLVVGCKRHVGLVSTDASSVAWTPRAPLPSSNYCEKFQQYIVWQHAGKLLAIHLQNTCLLEDEEEVHELCIRNAHAGVAACGNVVYSNSTALFMLPPEFKQTIAAVHGVTHEVVDVFTSAGDWWRVHVPTMSAHVVGLDIYPGTVVDVCAFISS